ncbi:MAG: hypothetical protein QG646_3956 [Euryarchaeota archaeon]|nr:hypothetical protein [Euryarchaeota archaeon]
MNDYLWNDYLGNDYLWNDYLGSIQARSLRFCPYLRS